jgi:hemoglobin-like flavoprotein
MSLSKELFLETLILIGENPDKFADDFYKRVEVNIIEFQEVFRNSDLRLQKSEFIKGILKIFSLYSNQTELDSFLIELGTRHVCYEVKEEHYPLIMRSLIEALKNLHKDGWTSKLESDWSELVEIVTKKMLVGCHKIKVAS